jgi:hypothetical protein
MKLPRANDSMANNPADSIKGLKNLLKLTPLLSIDITSVLLAIFEVKKITATNVNSGLKRLPK